MDELEIISVFEGGRELGKIKEMISGLGLRSCSVCHLL